MSWMKMGMRLPGSPPLESPNERSAWVSILALTASKCVMSHVKKRKQVDFSMPLPTTMGVAKYRWSWYNGPG